MSDEIILNHYKKLAAGWGLQGQMSMQDKVIRERETTFAVAQVKQCLQRLGVAPEQARVWDFGCGNGHLIQELFFAIDGLLPQGLEFVPELVALARSRNLPGVHITHGDLRVAADIPRDIHVAITERSVINLLSWEEQKKALTNIAQALVPGGFYVMIESFEEGHREMNAARSENQLPEVPVSGHNRYLKEPVLDSLAAMGLRETQGVEPKNALSTHFFLSRVFQHLFVQEGRPASERVWQFFSQGLPPDVGNYSPILLRVFQKDAL